VTLVIADTGPIHYLLLIDAIGILPELYDRVLLPTAVRNELTHPNSPAAAKEWIAALPTWCQIRNVVPSEVIPGLGPGEAEAIALAQEVKADLILLDDRAARGEALRRGLLVAGTIGVLADAAEHGLTRLPEALDRLSCTTFYAAPDLLAEVLARDVERLQRRPMKPDDPDP
jgi:predicted nucleic acid-binding protein